MANLICWICKENRPCKEWEGKKYLDEDGNKPCLECLLEEGAFDEEEVEAE